jgi:hypothetical protein
LWSDYWRRLRNPGIRTLSRTVVISSTMPSTKITPDPGRRLGFGTATRRSTACREAAMPAGRCETGSPHRCEQIGSRGSGLSGYSCPADAPDRGCGVAPKFGPERLLSSTAVPGQTVSMIKSLARSSPCRSTSSRSRSRARKPSANRFGVSPPDRAGKDLAAQAETGPGIGEHRPHLTGPFPSRGRNGSSRAPAYQRSSRAANRTEPLEIFGYWFGRFRTDLIASHWAEASTG